MCFTTKPFEVKDFLDLDSYQSFEVTRFEGATIQLDLRAVGSLKHPDKVQYECRLRISDVKKQIPAVAISDIVAEEYAPWLQQIESFTVPQIRTRLQQNGDEEAANGKVRRDELLAALRSSERRKRPAPTRIVARSGQTGLVVKQKHASSNDKQRIAVSFEPRQFTWVLPKHVRLGAAVLSTGREELGEGSTYQVAAGSITFKTDKTESGDEEVEYFLNSQPIPAGPGVLVPWTTAFMNRHVGTSRGSLFKITEPVQCRAHAKLVMTLVRHASVSKVPDFNTPEPKRKRVRTEC